MTAAVSRVVNHVHPDVVRHHWPGQDDVLDARGAADLGGRENWIEQQAGLVLHLRLVARLPEPGAGGGSATVRPDDRIVDGAACRPLPDNAGFALVGNTDAGQVIGTDSRLAQSGLAGPQARGPDLVRHVLDPPGRRVMLGKIHAAHAGDILLGVEDDGTAGGRSLVNDKYIGSHAEPAEQC